MSTLSAALTRRSATTLAFGVLAFALCVAKALGREIEYELLILTASIAGLDSAVGVVRGGVGAIGARLAERAAQRDEGEGAEETAQPAEQLPSVPAYPYEPIPSELDAPAPLWPAVDLAEIVAPSHLAVVLYRVSMIAPGATPEAFDSLPRQVQSSWLDVADMAAALIRGEPDALAEYLEHLAYAADAYDGERVAADKEPVP